MSLAALSGCIDSNGKPDANYESPNGYRCFIPYGSSVPESTLGLWVDIRCDAWIQQRKAQWGIDIVTNCTYSTTYHVIDDWRFAAPGLSNTGYAAGTINTGADYPLMKACIYAGAPGQLPASGIGLAAINHELDHLLGYKHGDPEMN